LSDQLHNPAALHLEKQLPGTHWIGSWVGPISDWTIGVNCELRECFVTLFIRSGFVAIHYRPISWGSSKSYTLSRTRAGSCRRSHTGATLNSSMKNFHRNFSNVGSYEYFPHTILLVNIVIVNST